MAEPRENLVLIRIEERLNSRIAADRGSGASAGAPAGKAAAVPGLSERSRAELEAALLRRRRADTAADYVLELLPRRGYALKDGQPDCVRFYRQALIAPDVWSTFLSHTHAPSKTTLFRIVFALRMNEEEARNLLSLAGSGFSATDLTDQLVLACLDCGITDPATVYEVFEFYREAHAEKGRVLRNLYGAPH